MESQRTGNLFLRLLKLNLRKIITASKIFVLILFLMFFSRLITAWLFQFDTLNPDILIKINAKDLKYDKMFRVNKR